MACVDVVFTLTGNTIPVDHGYHLLSSISKHIPEVHGNGEIGIHSINGRLNGDRTASITEKSCLRIRIDADQIPKVIPLAGKRLDLSGHAITVGVPRTRALIPAARLYSRLVVIKGFTEPEGFLDACRRQLAEMNIKAAPSLVSTQVHAKANENRKGGIKSPWLRRTLKIRDKTVVGFALNVEGLTAEESIVLQERGLGGRRRFGCGIFFPGRG